jgi:hypothetical protein
MALRELAIADAMPETTPGDPTASAILVPLTRADLPDPLPLDWVMIRDSHPIALVLIVTRSRIDWSRFDVCLRLDQGATHPCQESGLLFEEDAPGLDPRHMPRGGPHWRGSLALRLPFRTSMSGRAEAIFMPRMINVCGGRIGAAADGVSVTADRRHAVVPATALTEADRLELEWSLGTPECDGERYDGWPPFVVAGEAETVQLVESILRQHEVADGG